MYKYLHFFIDFDWEKYIDNEDQYLIDIGRIVDSAYMHKATVYYSEEQLKEFISIISDLDDDFIQSKGNILDTILKNSIPQESTKFIFDISFGYDKTHIKYNPFVHVKSDSPLAILSLTSDSTGKYLLYVKKHDEMELLKVSIFDKIPDVFSWIQNIQLREFNKSAKHGENGKGNWAGESCLLCSSDEAQKLLNTSIPDFEKIEKRLFNYDSLHNTYVEFFYEGDNPQNKWHGFHLKEEDWGRVPEKVKNYYGKK